MLAGSLAHFNLRDNRFTNQAGSCNTNMVCASHFYAGVACLQLAVLHCACSTRPLRLTIYLYDSSLHEVKSSEHVVDNYFELSLASTVGICKCQGVRSAEEESYDEDYDRECCCLGILAGVLRFIAYRLNAGKSDHERSVSHNLCSCRGKSILQEIE